MITLLRKIRRSLIESGSARKYLLYAIGEIALVVIGILIALQINNWNERVKQQTQVNSYLSSMIENLRDDQQSLTSMKNQLSFRYHSLNYLLKHSNGDPVDPEIVGAEPPLWQPNNIWNEDIPEHYDNSFAIRGIIWLPRVQGRIPNQSAYQEMNNAGLLSSIDNKELKLMIDGFYEDWDISLGEQRLSQDRKWIDQWTNSLIDVGIYPFLIEDGEDPLSYVNDPRRLALLERITLSSCYHTLSCERLLTRANDLIEILELEL